MGNRIVNYGLGSLITTPSDTEITKHVLYSTHFIVSSSDTLRTKYNIDKDTFTPRDVEYFYISAPNVSASKSDELILYLHGGGYSLGGPSHLGFASRLSASTATKVLFVHYAKPPSADIPFQVDQILTIYLYLLTRAHGAVQSKNIIICADSAGRGR